MLCTLLIFTSVIPGSVFILHDILYLLNAFSLESTPSTVCSTFEKKSINSIQLDLGRKHSCNYSIIFVKRS